MDKYKIVCCPITKMEDETGDHFFLRLKNEINSWDEDTFFGIFPEYCYGNLSHEYVFKKIDELKEKITINCGLVLGTHAFDNGSGNITNNAIILLGDTIIYRTKETILSGENMRTSVSSMKNSGVFEYKDKKIAVIVCADIWKAELLYELVIKQGAEFLLVPAFTVVAKDLSAYARQQWLSLGIVRSREFLIPIAVADHYTETETYSVGKASFLVDPSLKNSDLKEQNDFLITSENGSSISYEFTLSNINEYREYRKNLGILES